MILRHRTAAFFGFRVSAEEVVMAASLALIAVMDPVAGRLEGKNRRQTDDGDENPSHGGSVAHLKVGKRLFVEVERVEQRRIGRTALSATDDVGGGERLERAYGLHHEVEENDWRQKG